MKISGNEPAQPITDIKGYPFYITALENSRPTAIGLTIRQRFAMAAMQGLLSNQMANYPIRADVNPNTVAKAACDYADALIAELNRAEE